MFDSKLFLATISSHEHRYMSGSQSLRDQHRLVWASDRDEAERKARAAVQRDDPYGTSIEVDHVEISEAIE